METISSQTISIEKLHRLAFDNDISFVSYRLPGASVPVTLVQWLQNPALLKDISQLQNQSGFVFAPFDLSSGIPIRLIQPDLIIIGENFHEPPRKTSFPTDTSIDCKTQNLSLKPNYITSKEEFIDQVKQAQKVISGNSIKKVVLSRINKEDKPENFDSASFFHALEQAYPDAFVFSLYIPDTGLWFGASPEPLLISNEREISTVSLAGTRKTSADNLSKPWGEKEIDEQLIVTQYIDQILNKYKVSKLKKSGPVSQLAGKIEHLKTTFTFSMEKMDTKLAEFLDELHPTPSVCGLPKDISLQLIRNIEKHRREYYSGFLGPVNMNGEWNLYVNLRSMKSLETELEYYLGAGITKGSKAEDEWEETNNKMNTLKSIVESLKENKDYVI
jgi:isochorismate synthase